MAVPLAVRLPPTASAASSGLTYEQTHAITIDTVLFDATVPSTAHVGENVSVRVHLTNHSNESLPILIGLTVPVNIIYVTPLLIHTTIGPQSQLTKTFYLVMIQQNPGGAANVTAKVWIWFFNTMKAPELVQETSALVYSIGPSPEAPLAAAGVALLAAAVIVVVFVVWRRSARKAQGNPDAGGGAAPYSHTL